MGIGPYGPRTSFVRCTGSGSTLRFTTGPGRACQLQSAGTLAPGGWLTVLSVSARPVAQSLEFPDTAPGGQSRYYRVLVSSAAP